MSISRRLLAVPVVLGALILLVLLLAQGHAKAGTHLSFNHLNKIQRRLVSEPMALALGPAAGAVHPNTAVTGGDGDQADGLPSTPPRGYDRGGASSSGPANYEPTDSSGCNERLAGNVKVNQNCLNVSDPDLQGRGQANNESFIAEDPFHPQNIVASDNNYIRGDGTCGAHYSLDGGNSWQDSTVPNNFSRGFAGNAREYWQSGGDTSVAWDTRGNAYMACQVFNRGNVGNPPTSPNPDDSSAFLVFRSTGNDGASWNFPGRYAKAYFDPQGTCGCLEDKELLTVDNHMSSPYRDRVYVTWTEFAADGTGYIYESHSSDYGETFSAPVVVSTDSPLCSTTYGLATPHGACNENQFSDPFTGPDGNLYVVYNNYNNTPTGTDNRNQFLISKSTDGGNTFSAPVKVSDYYDLPDCETYQGDDAGRACVPEKGSSTKSVFRATNYPSGAVDPTDANRIVVTFGSYINRDSNESNGCVPAGFQPDFGTNLYTGVKTPGACNNKILVSVSNDGAATFSGTGADPRTEPVVPQDPGQARTDQFWQWEAFTRDGRLAVDYYDRQYGGDEYTGASDFTLSGSRNLADFAAQRVTSSSMPAPTEFYGAKGGLFYGDYTGLTAVDQAHPIWSDTRNPDVFVCPGTATGPGNPPQLCTGIEPNGERANDEDTFSARMAVPEGRSYR